MILDLRIGVKFKSMIKFDRHWKINSKLVTCNSIEINFFILLDQSLLKLRKGRNKQEKCKSNAISHCQNGKLSSAHHVSTHLIPPLYANIALLSRRRFKLRIKR